MVKFHGDLPYKSMDIIKRTDLLDERDMIGSGRFGTVYQLVMDDGNIFAAKRIADTCNFFLAWFAEDCVLSQTFVQLSLTPTSYL